MQVSVESLEGLQRKMTVTIDSDRLTAATDQRINKLMKEVKIKGFRPGHVPEKVVRQQHGQAAHQEAVQELIRATLGEAFQQAEVQPAGFPDIDIAQSTAGQPLVYTATFDVFPEVKIQDHAGMKLEKITAPITEEDIDFMVNKLREQQASFEKADVAADKGHQVVMDFAGFVDGESMGASGNSTDFKLELGSGQMIPGFEDGILGHKAGEEFTISVAFPDEYHAKELAGKPAEFKITLKEVQHRVLPELDAAFAEKIGATDTTVEGLRAELQKNMTRDLGNAIDAKMKETIFDKLLEEYTFDVPEGLLKQEIQQLKENMMRQFNFGNKDQQMDLPDDLFKEQAARRVRIGLILSEYAKANEIKAEADKVREKVEQMAQAYEKPEEVLNWYYGNQERLQEVEASVIETQIMEQLLDKADVTEKSQTYQEVMHAKKD